MKNLVKTIAAVIALTSSFGVAFAVPSVDKSTDMPGWVRISVSDEYSVYANFGKLKKQGNKMEIFWLSDFNEAQTTTPIPYLSMLTLSEINCTESLMRTKKLVWFGGNMAGGETLHEKDLSNNPKWIQIVDGSVSRKLFNLGCVK